MYSLEYDEDHGLIRCAVSRHFSVEDVERQAVLAAQALDRCRARHGDLKILSIIDSAIQDGEVMVAAQRTRAAILTGPYDRMAFVFRSSLAKQQMGGFFESTKEKAFVSENAAITWLLADRQMNRGVAA